MRYLLILACLPLLALDNAKTLYNRTSGALASHPITLHYWLAQGEVFNFPRPYLTPSDTGIRTAAPQWQADVKSRWRDGSATRSITGVLSGDPWWATGGNGLTNIVVSSQVATITTTVPHGLKMGDRVVVSMATGDNDLNRDHYTVIEAPATAYTFKVRCQSVANGTYNNAGLTVTHVLDPWASGQCRVKAPNHQLEVSELVTIAGVDGMSRVNGSWLVSAVSRDEFEINTTCAGTFVAGGTVTGPDWGSVKSAHVSFWSGIPASGNVKVDVVNSAAPCHLGSVVDCRDASTSVATLTQDVSWGAQLDATAAVASGSTATKNTNAKTMLSAWDGVESYCGTRYWLRGPVVTQWIVEGCAGVYDFGWKPVMSSLASPNNGAALTAAITASDTSFVIDSAPAFAVGARLWFTYSAAGWMTAESMLVTNIVGNTITVTRAYSGSTAYPQPAGKKFGVLQWQDSADPAWDKAIHPSFAITYYPGWSGVRVETRVENPWWERQASLWFSATLKTGAALAARLSYGETLLPHKARHRWQLWDGADAEHYCEGGSGTDPENCATTGGGTRASKYRVDHNRQYLEYAGAFPVRYDQDWSAEVTYWIDGYDRAGSWRWGWHYSDKGAWGSIKKNLPAGLSPSDAKWPSYYLGGGTAGNESRGWWNEARNWQTDASGQYKPAEGFWPNETDAIFLHCNFCDGGYEMSMGTSVPGGGGNAAAESHWSMFSRENAARPFVAGWPDSAAGRIITTHGRPQLVTAPNQIWMTAAAGADSTYTTCGNTAASGGGVLGSTPSWPCNAYDTGIASQSGIAIESGHVYDYGCYIPWVLNGDEFTWQLCAAKAAWASGLGYVAPSNPGISIGRNLGKIWAGMSSAGHVRIESQPNFAIVNALMATPTEPLFGQSYIPERPLFNAYLWNIALKQEGERNVRGGWAEQLYPLKFSADCTTYSWVLTVPSSSDPYRLGRCAIGQTNALAHPSPALYPASDQASHAADIDITKVSSVDSIWMMSYPALVETHLTEIGGPQARYTRNALGKWWMNSILNRQTNPYLTNYYRAPIRLTATGARAQTWAEYLDAWTPAAQARNSHASGSLIGYNWRMWAALSLLADVPGDSTTPGCTPADRPPNGCTMQAAIDWMLQTNPQQGMWAINVANEYMPRWSALAPRPRITSVRATLSGGTATIQWVAPDGAACTVGLDPTSSYTTSDATATAVGRLQSWSGSATAGQTYRITCGKARTTGVL